MGSILLGNFLAYASGKFDFLITIAELKTADEAFISSSTKRITAVRQIDDYVLPTITDQSISFKLFALLKERELK